MAEPKRPEQYNDLSDAAQADFRDSVFVGVGATYDEAIKLALARAEEVIGDQDLESVRVLEHLGTARQGESWDDHVVIVHAKKRKKP